MKIKTNELQGAALDWAVAKCEGFVPFTDGVSWVVDKDGAYIQLPNYSTDWAQGGPIIEREKIDVCWCKKWFAWAKTKFEEPSDEEPELRKEGPTPLIAAMRCYVASELGDEVELPEGI